MANPPIPGTGIGNIVWQNDINNWRAGDADWLQQRGILRWANDAARASAPTYKAAGSISYVASPAKFVANVGGADRAFFFTNFLTAATDTSTLLDLRIASGSVGVQLQPSAVSISGLNSTTNLFNAGRLQVSSTEVRVLSPNSASSAVITKDDAAGPLNIVVPAVRISGTLTVQTSAIVSGEMAANTLKVPSTGTTYFTVTGGGVVTGVSFNGALNGLVTAPVGTNTFAGSVEVGGASGTALSGSSIASKAVPTNAIDTNSGTGMILKTSGTNRTRLTDNGGTTSAQVATVIVSAVTPAGDLPDGCIWITP